MLSLRTHLGSTGIGLLAAAAAFLDVQAITNVPIQDRDGPAVAAPARPAASPIEAEREQAPRTVHATDAEPILARNPFDSTTGPIVGAVAEETHGRGNVAERVTQVGPYEYRLPRAVLDQALYRQADEVMRFARVVPEMQNPAGRGLRLFGVRAGGGLEAVGLEQGDLLQRINDYDIIEPDKALEAYARLRTSDVLVVRLVRRKTPMVLVYYIV